MNMDDRNEITMIALRNKAIAELLIAFHGSNQDQEILNDEIMCSLADQISVNSKEIYNLAAGFKGDKR